MENAHAAHKEDYSGLLSAIAGAVARIKRPSEARSRGLVVTPWSGRSPAGWSA
ncbi:MAG: hypothetical protein Q7U72_05245 [Brevundimonas sp.]|uniref:hypothetical protein n=1 Tax=Brevundimonas sp. TaxID=1871086 RepID=UPI00271EE09F|nr:hypothetical protein [Brevundimonas sp.]MDO9076841.1 hypothetical protein [Brevundimonas sp.]MDZ4061631.1 hypothetical protein [Brevundimonas sp.]